MPFFNHRQFNFHFKRIGQGPVFVFTHGLSSDLSEMQSLLGEPNGYSLLLWDTRGHGLTNPLGKSDGYSFKQFANDLHELLAYLGIKRAVLGGMSMGAGIAIRFAVDWPETVRGLVLVRPAWLDRASPERLMPVVRIGQLLAEQGAERGIQQFRQSKEYQSVHRIDPRAAEMFCEQFRKTRAAERHIRLRRIPEDCPIGGWNEVSAITMPTLVIGCQQDFAHPMEYAIEWHHHLASSQLNEAPSKVADEAAYRSTIRILIDAFVNSLTVN